VLGWKGRVVERPAGESGGARADLLAGLENKTGQIGIGVKRQKEKVFKFLKTLNQSNSNLDLNSNTSKECTDMNATVNSYISLIS
jgi:1-aminocyclopropane-1-carboxylate deaminase/D-cysteine desulfhydrase-like pyridoxal-dependent ACC family enzyme